MAETKRPPFSALPLDPNGPPGNAWGLYGADDCLGALNLLTPAVVVSAATEIKTGERVSLDWQLTKPSRSSFGRDPFASKFINKTKPGAPHRCVNDDILTFNTQCSSQWDGLRHYGYQKAQRYYNNTTPSDLSDPAVLSIDAVAEKGGIVGRGVLLDYAAYCARHNITVDPLASSAIKVDDLQKVADEQGVAFKQGDILFIRGGYTAAYNALSPEQREAVGKREPDPALFLGVEPSATTLKWIWETGFAAVAGDMPSFEQAPLAGPHTHIGGIWKGESWEEEMQGGGLLHQWLLGGWGLPIGELFDLETLSKRCAEMKRWTFFLSSVPLKVPGGVASPPNAVAIF
ncbi:putative cyclase [Diplogelasinospora grovesii]|uniref:Cyclase n=1 Tax=Diplogelasinospora grovesii TaxID=303347 RepID=A0AAN6MY99_9PEZI|nr:putative cyclase [Diplogelasinospora grovesii]